MKNYISLKNSKEFGRVYQCGKSFANKFLVMYALENDGKDNRLGISVSKKVGNSVVRHHVTRLVRESYRLHKEEIKKGYDIVVVARANTKDSNYLEVEQAFMHLVKLHHLRLDDLNEKDIY